MIKEALRRELQPVRDFQLAYNVPIYIGDQRDPLGSGRRALSADVTEIFEEYGWDWSYHAFREWSGWSLEHSDNEADTQPVAMPPERQKVIRKWFDLNRKATR